MEFRDYYKVLGVDRTVDQKAISAAFRKLARKYHPDVNKARGAEDRFKEINEAYQVLGDAEKRARYDQMYELHQRGGADWATIFGQGAPTGRRGTFRVDLGGLGGMGGFSEFFQQFFGDLGAESVEFGEYSRPESAPVVEAPPVEISLEEAYRGVRKPIEFQVDGARERGELVIPAGVRSGQRIRLSGGADRRDRYLTVQVRPHGLYERREDDLYVEVPITLAEAMLGAEIEVPTVEGKVKMTIPPETQNSQLFRLRGLGMPRLRRGGRGDQMVRIKVILPDHLSAQERQLFEELRKIRQENPRAKLGLK